MIILAEYIIYFYSFKFIKIFPRKLNDSFRLTNYNFIKYQQDNLKNY